MSANGEHSPEGNALICPCCEVPLHDVSSEVFSASYCRTGCGGVWFSREDFQCAIDPASCARLPELDAPKRATPQTATRHPCPLCRRAILHPRWFDGQCQETIEECPRCGGTWLTSTALQAIRTYRASTTPSEKHAADPSVVIATARLENELRARQERADTFRYFSERLARPVHGLRHTISDAPRFTPRQRLSEMPRPAHKANAVISDTSKTPPRPAPAGMHAKRRIWNPEEESCSPWRQQLAEFMAIGCPPDSARVRLWGGILAPLLLLGFAIPYFLGKTLRLYGRLGRSFGPVLVTGSGAVAFGVMLASVASYLHFQCFWPYKDEWMCAWGKFTSFLVGLISLGFLVLNLLARL